MTEPHHTMIDNYAVFGNPIAHSKSPTLQTAFAEQTQQELTYKAQCVELNHFETAANKFFANNGKGLNITVPFKEDAFNYAKKLTPRAKRAGAVNTLVLQSNGEVVGDNTDGVGLVTDITSHLNWKIKGKRILILGAGGAVRGILEPFIQESPSTIVIANRTKEKAEKLANDFSDIFPITACSFSELAGQSFDLIINGTSASLSGKLPPLPIGITTENTCCYDMMYSKQLTPFLLWAEENSVKNISDGLGMLVCQGAESFFIWRGVRPETKAVIDTLREALSN